MFPNIVCSFHLKMAEAAEPDYYNINESVKRSRRRSGNSLFTLVVVSFGLLCILQASLNVYLRLALWHHSDTNASHTEELLQSLTVERDQLRHILWNYNEYSQRGWVHFAQSVYFISRSKESWQKSRDDCRQRGADLVIINSKEEQDFLKIFNSAAWIGLTDSETEEEWRWVDGTRMNTSFWSSGEPNGFEGVDEDCGQIRFFENENSLNDAPCEENNIWICEKKIETMAIED